MSSYTRQRLALYQVKCRAQIDKLFYGVCVGFHTNLLSSGCLRTLKIRHFVENEVGPDCEHSQECFELRRVEVNHVY